jgi:hypothetical protein
MQDPSDKENAPQEDNIASEEQELDSASKDVPKYQRLIEIFKASKKPELSLDELQVLAKEKGS